jgi:hypothetical protein
MSSDHCSTSSKLQIPPFVHQPHVREANKIVVGKMTVYYMTRHFSLVSVTSKKSQMLVKAQRIEQEYLVLSYPLSKQAYKTCGSRQQQCTFKRGV